MTKFMLQALAMIFMLCDHLGATLFPGQLWLGWVGRLAFPIFAFLLVEGYFHTGDFKAYAKRIFLFAILSEIPMNLIYGGAVVYPFHQNVLWLFLIALFYLKALDRIFDGKDGKGADGSILSFVGKLLLMIAVTVLAYVICFVGMVDYYGYGLLMILIFYCSKKVPQQKGPVPAGAVFLFQLLAMYFVNVRMIMGEMRAVEVFGFSFELTIQGLALLALPLIWLYNGKQGYHSRWWRWFCYAFYPFHMLVIGVVWRLVA